MQESAYSSITVEKGQDFVDNLIITVTFNPTSHVHNWDTANWEQQRHPPLAQLSWTPTAR